MIRSKEFRECPFCGSQNIQVCRDFGSTWGITKVYCLGCKAQVKWDIELGDHELMVENNNKWADKWNNRDGSLYN